MTKPAEYLKLQGFQSAGGVRPLGLQEGLWPKGDYLRHKCWELFRLPKCLFPVTNSSRLRLGCYFVLHGGSRVLPIGYALPQLRRYSLGV